MSISYVFHKNLGPSQAGTSNAYFQIDYKESTKQMEQWGCLSIHLDLPNLGRSNGLFPTWKNTPLSLTQMLFLMGNSI